MPTPAPIGLSLCWLSYSSQTSEPSEVTQEASRQEVNGQRKAGVEGCGQEVQGFPDMSG